MMFHASFGRLLKENCKASVVSTSHLDELQQEIECRWSRGEFNEEFSREYLPRFKFTVPSEIADAQSLIVVAMPIHQLGQLSFGKENRSLSFFPQRTQLTMRRESILNMW